MVEQFKTNMNRNKKMSTLNLVSFWQVSVGTQDVNINPLEGEGGGGRNACLNIPTHNFTSNNGHQVKSYVLVFRVSLVHDQENGKCFLLCVFLW